ncbi:MAG: hypothetical protein DRJ09_04845 [Bacteroidetes bacterium]|nr:MAG: hypothetical protein DRJ09_04845 [Bacteroidota bacterium]
MIADKYYLLSRGKQRLFYSLLLIATPFLLLQNYLQSFIGKLSDINITLFEKDIPVIPLFALLLVLFLTVWWRKKITRTRVVGWVVVVIMFWLGQHLTDFYFHHRFYDLQYNWHYLAYATFAFLNYRFLKEKGAKRSKVLLSTFISALIISTFDEMIQIPLSNRVFDLGDVSKDLWGTMIGLVFVFVIIENGKMFSGSWKIRYPKLKDYLSDAVALFFYLTLFALLFMAFTSVLSDTRYIFQAVAFPVALFLVFFLLIHLSQFKVRWALWILIAALLGGLVTLQVKYHSKGVVAINNYLFLYKGVPIYYLDILIYPNQTFRPVDKKDFFNQRDKKTIKKLSDNILLIAAGSKRDGGKGFDPDKISYFVYNEFRQKGMQIIILDNKSAFEQYNRLMSEGKQVTMIVKND